MAYEVNIRANISHALFDLKGEKQALMNWLPEIADSFPRRANSFSVLGRKMLYWIGPAHWILRGPLSEEADLHEMLRTEAAPVNISLVLVSDALRFFEISGPDTLQLVAIASPLDTHPTVFPVNSATYTEAFGLKALISHTDSGYEIAVDRSFATMTEDYLMRAVGS